MIILLLQKKSCIRETPTLLTDAERRTDTKLKRLRDLSFFLNAVQKNWGESPPPPRRRRHLRRRGPIIA